MSSPRPAHLRAAAALAALGLLSLTACGQETAHSAPAKAAATNTVVSKTAGADPLPTVTTPRPLDPLAPKTQKAVIRGSKAPGPRLSATPATFASVVKYGDGVTLGVKGIQQGTVSEQGPGFLKGQPMTTFSLILTNRSKGSLDLSQVVVTAVYGKPARTARPVYGKASADFTGQVAAGKQATASYVFSIPAAELTNVSVTVDFDGHHAAATFHGKAR